MKKRIYTFKAARLLKTNNGDDNDSSGLRYLIENKSLALILRGFDISA